MFLFIFHKTSFFRYAKSIHDIFSVNFMTSFLFHLGIEDIPATYQQDGQKHLENSLQHLLSKEFSFLNFSSFDTFIGLRHMAFRLNDVSLKKSTEEKKGPLVSLGPEVFQKFLQSQDLTPEECFQKEFDKGVFWMGRVSHEKKNLAHVLENLTAQVLRNFPWPKTMTWPQSPEPWVRPVRFVTALLGSHVVPMTFFGQESQNFLQGHHLLENLRKKNLVPPLHSSLTKAPKAPRDSTLGDFFLLGSSQDYEEALKSIGVMPHKIHHKDYLHRAIVNLLEPQGLELHSNNRESLLEENMGLVSWPVPLLGTFDEKFLELPEGLVLNILAHHQRCFCTTKKEDINKSLTNVFLVVADGCPTSNESQEDFFSPEKGYRRVVQARLTDGAFFCQEDKKKPLLDHNKALFKRSFFHELGSFGEKVQRLCHGAPYLGKFYGETHNFSQEDQDIFQILVHCSKSAMACALVEEYPELQGLLGAYYGTEQGLPQAKVLETYGTWHGRSFTHYGPPVFPGETDNKKALQHWFLTSENPHGPLDAFPSLCKEEVFSGLLGFLDTTDTLVGFFSLGKVPTGSKDPMALRRACHGLLKALLSLKLSISLGDFFQKIQQSYHHQGFCKDYWPQWKSALQDFIMDRLDHLFPLIYGVALSQNLKACFTQERGFFLNPCFIASLGVYEAMVQCSKEFIGAYNRVFSLINVSSQEILQDKIPSLKHHKYCSQHWESNNFEHKNQEFQSLQKNAALEPQEKALEDLLAESWGFWPTKNQLVCWANCCENLLDSLHIQDQCYGVYRQHLLRKAMEKIPFFYNL